MSVSSMFAPTHQSREVSGLKDRVAELEAEIAHLRTQQPIGFTADDKVDLEQRIAELTDQLATRGGVHEVSIELIQPDPDQPRTIYPESVIHERAESLRREGQHSPIILIPLDDGQYRLFDGHLRRFAAPLAGLNTLKAVFREDSDPIERFDQQLTTSIQSEKLHDLDLAAGLIRLIGYRSKLTATDIPALTNSALQRLKRMGTVGKLKSLQAATADAQKQWLQEQGLEEKQQQVLQVILGKGLNPVSINSNAFPLLRLPNDVQEAIRQGLEASKAKALGQLTAEKLETTPAIAKKLRKRLIQDALKEQLSLSVIRRRIRELIRESTAQPAEPPTHAPDGQRSIRQSVQQVKGLLDGMAIDPLQDRSHLEALKKALEEQLSQVQQLLGGQA